MSTVDEVLNLARQQIGIRGTNNKFNTWYWGHECYDANTYPWCAAAQSWLADQVGGLGYTYSAAVSGIVNQLQRIPDNEARPGDYVGFNWDGRRDTGWMDHIGLVEWSTIGMNDYFGTLEGNTGSAPGGEFMRVTRHNESNYFTAFFRPVYDGQGGHVPTPAPDPAPSGDLSVRYRVMNVGAGEWLPEMINRHDTGGSSDTWAGNGQPIGYLAMDFPGYYRVRSDNGWLDKVYKYDPNDLVNGAAGDGTPIHLVECYYDTPDPDRTGYIQIRYALANVGEDFLPEMEDNVDTGGSSDRYAGTGGNMGRFYAYLKR